MKTHAYTHEDDLADIFVGRRIVETRLFDDAPTIDKLNPRFDVKVGRLTLDDGTQVYVLGNEGASPSCCESGHYDLTKLATTEHIITAAKVVEEPSKGRKLRAKDRKNSGSRTDPGSATAKRWSLYVYAGHEKINAAAFDGDDGNGYYGTGFNLIVVPA